jgi:hypothetical protein
MFIFDLSLDLLIVYLMLIIILKSKYLKIKKIKNIHVYLKKKLGLHSTFVLFKICEWFQSTDFPGRYLWIGYWNTILIVFRFKLSFKR